MRSALKSAQSQDRAHLEEQRDTWTFLRVICWELKLC